MHTLVLELRESIKLLVISMLALTKVVHTRVLLTSMHTWRRTDCQRFSLPSSFSLLSLLPRSLMDGTSCGRLIIIRYFTVNLVRRIYFKHGNSMSLQEPIWGRSVIFHYELAWLRRTGNTASYGYSECGKYTSYY